ncbi:peptidylprolyl isomerase [Flavobacteriaceae bacterium AU392]|nr:peptidylprolyl isomerase [Flavobacteriaceae bacterium]RKM86833.1 peptidylprolyl isomerase [Flavobacteriaceae bacterium AU392]
MKIGKIIFFILCLTVILNSCGNDDDDINIQPPRDRAEQQVIDRDTLLEYLNTHFYNSASLANNPNPTINDIIISEVPPLGGLPDPANNTLLIDAVEIRQTVFAGVDYEFYILNIRTGGGTNSPNVSDNVLVNFSGSLLDGEVFDDSVNPIDFDLIGVVPGFSRAFLDFNEAESFNINPDGTVDFINPGIGVVFMPSGLGFFDNPSASSGIPFFAPLIFKFELFSTRVNDHDDDGIPSYLEDLNNDLDVRTDDTDEDGSFNFLDTDDDNDGVRTIDEDLEPDTDLTVDRDGDGDPTNDIGDGNPLNDDTDGDGIPNYLDPDSTQSRNDS